LHALWDSREAYFPETQVFANIQLSRYGTETSGQFAQFAEAYIVSSETPMITVGTVSFPSRRDNTVYLRTGHLNYLLEVDNASASAVFTIFDTTPESSFELSKAEHRLAVAVVDEAGYVVGTHRAVRLPGGEDSTTKQQWRGSLRGHGLKPTVTWMLSRSTSARSPTTPSSGSRRPPAGRCLASSPGTGQTHQRGLIFHPAPADRADPAGPCKTSSSTSGMRQRHGIGRSGRSASLGKQRQRPHLAATTRAARGSSPPASEIGSSRDCVLYLLV
jgi:hypothetical protein